MKLFECQHCGQPLFFMNTRCENCGRSLGYLPAKATISALEPDNGVWRALAEPALRYRSCANAQYDICNWLVEADSPDVFCAACRHNRTIPDLSFPQNLANWRKVELAKHRLFYSLLRLGLPLTTFQEDPEGLTFDFLVAPLGGPVMTGHAGGLITINVAEADDSIRERQRAHLDEPYRTLLGHFRHEIAHYYWDHLVRDSENLERFRALFGDEREDYNAALQRYYANGPVPDWPDRFVSAYASSHPWEDFAETWAHYFHMVDTLETASAFGLRLRPRVAQRAELATEVDFDPYTADMDRIVESWPPLTVAVNAINRSMGIADLYPFVLARPALVKLTFVHDGIHESGFGPPGRDGRRGFRRIVDRLKQTAARPRHARALRAARRVRDTL
jgi:hypothetical protein